MPKPLLVVDGVIPSKSFFQDKKWDYIVACDGAAYKLKCLSLMPDLIIGDLDSLFKIHQVNEPSDLSRYYPNSDIIQITNQNTTDSDKGLDYLVEKNAPKIVVTGLFGREIDHAYYNMHLLGRYASKIQIMAYHPLNDNYSQWTWVLSGKHEFELPKDTLISLLPLNRCQLSSHGLKWDLSDAILETSTTMSARNQTLYQKVQVQVSQGHVLCVVRLKTGQEPVLIQ